MNKVRVEGGKKKDGLLALVFEPRTVVLQGGYKLQVLDSLQRPVLDLTPVTKDSEFVRTDVT